MNIGAQLGVADVPVPPLSDNEAGRDTDMDLHDAPEPDKVPTLQ